LKQQTATSEVLKLISRSTFDLDAVLSTLLESACTLCGAEGAVLFRPDSRGDYLPAAFHSPRPDRQSDAEYLEYLRTHPIRPNADSVAGRALMTRATAHLEDVSRDPDYGRADLAQRAAFKSVLAVPLLREGEPIGVIAMSNGAGAGAFTAAQVELVTTFADQAVIAIENVRLFNETKDALDRQTATAEILRVISASPTNVQPVLEAVAERAALLSDAAHSSVLLAEGDVLRQMAVWSNEPGVDPVPGHGLPIRRTLVNGRAFIERRTIHVEDAELVMDTEYPDIRESYEHFGFRTMLAVPMLREGVAVGTIFIWRREVRPFSAAQIALLQTFADQSVIAIQNAQAFNETKEALEQQTATSEILQVISNSVSDTQPVFDKIMDSCYRLFDGSEMGILLLGEDGQLHLGAHRGSALETLKKLYPIPVDGTVPGLALVDQKILHYPDVLNAVVIPPMLLKIAKEVGNYSVIVAPMIWKEQSIGTVHVTRTPPQAFTDKEINLLKTFADQAVIAIQNARLFREIQDKGQQLELANKHKSEFLANMSHELRTPLNAIIGFSEVLSEQMFGDVNEKQLEYLQDIHSSGHHLLTLINDILDLSKIEAGRMELDLASFNLPMLLDNTTTLVRERAMRQGLKLALDVQDGVGDWVADPRKLKQVVINLLSNAVKFTPAGGSVVLRARRVEQGVEIAVIDTGVGIAPDQQALVFEEFRQAGGDYLRKAEGTGLGLSLAKRFVELHGGAMRVDSVLGQGSTFAFIIPELALEELASQARALEASA
jgi:signal transduction histidine kinase